MSVWPNFNISWRKWIFLAIKNCPSPNLSYFLVAIDWDSCAIAYTYGWYIKTDKWFPTRTTYIIQWKLFNQFHKIPQWKKIINVNVKSKSIGDFLRALGFVLVQHHDESWYGYASDCFLNSHFTHPCFLPCLIQCSLSVNIV